jgi:hypothetical protein
MYHTVEECKKTGTSVELDMHNRTTPKNCPLKPRKPRQPNNALSESHEI